MDRLWVLDGVRRAAVGLLSPAAQLGQPVSITILTRHEEKIANFSRPCTQDLDHKSTLCQSPLVGLLFMNPLAGMATELTRLFLW